MNQPLKKAHILLVDDDKQLAEAVSEYLELEDYQVTMLSSGEQALNWLTDNEPPDAMLLDIMMPNVDGFAVLEKMRTQEKTKHVPVIVFTALSDKKTEERARALSVAGILVKASMATPDIVEALKRALTV